MPTAASTRRRDNHNVNNGLSEEEQSLAQLQEAVQQNDQQRDDASKINPSDDSTSNTAAGNGGPATATYTDGAGKPIVAGADYASLRLLTRRQPKDPEHVLQGLDTSNVDLSWTAREDSNNLDPNGQPWRYPKKRGKGEGSNLDQFKDEITERTKNGEGCKAIAEAFIAMGVDTSVRAVARQRMKWGLRQRVCLVAIRLMSIPRTCFCLVLTSRFLAGQEENDGARHSKYSKGSSRTSQAHGQQ